MRTISTTAAILTIVAVSVFAQTRDAYESNTGTVTAPGLLDPSRFTIHHMMSFDASTANGSSIGSQSLYTTMIAYKVAEPVTLRLNFSLPLYSTYSPSSNLTVNNIKSLDYFKNMPYDVSLTWKPTNNMLLQLSVVKHTQADYYNAFLDSRYLQYQSFFNNP